MLDALIAIAFLFLANFILMIARRRERGFFRFLLSLIAFVMLFPAFLFAARAILNV